MKTLSILLFSVFFSIGVFAQADSKVSTQKHESRPVPSVKAGLFSEDFELGVFPPAGWTLNSGPTPQTWDSASSNPHTGLYYAHCLYDAALGTQEEYLISPAIDMSTATSAVLTFYFSLSKYWSISPYDNYDLYVMVSTDNGASFPDTVWSELDTDTSTLQNWTWTMAEVDLSSYAGNSSVSLAFVYSGSDGAEASIDDINVDATSSIDDIETNVSIYPNPAKDFLRIKTEKNYQSIKLVNINGKLVFSNSGELKNKVLNLNDIPAGIYFLSIEFKDFVYNKKVVIEK